MPEMMPSNLSKAEIDRFVQDAVSALKKGDLSAARAVARRGREAGLEHAFLLKVEALWLHDRKEYQEALKTFHHARTLTPDDPSILNGIAACLAGMGQQQAALKVIDESLRLMPSAAPTLFLQGWVLETAFEYDAARVSYEKTVAISPKHVQALAGLASVLVQLGDFDAARARAVQALALNQAEPAATMAFARAELAQGDAPSAEARLRKLLANNLPPRARGQALGVLGDALEAQDRPTEAFAAWQEKANEFAQLYATAAAPKAADALTPVAARLKEFPPERWAAQPETEQTAGTHVFVLGFLRSGTTLLQQILAAHPDAVAVDERGSLKDLGAEYMSSPQALDRLASLSPDELDEARTAYWQRLREFGVEPDGRIVIEKDPLNTINLPLIAKLFPQAKILFTIRDPRDVVLSCLRRPIEVGASKSELVSIEGCAALYDAVMSFGEVCRARLPIAIHEIRYEDIVDDFDSSIGGACNYLGIEYRDTMRDFSQSARSRTIRSSASANQVRRPLYRESVGAWRRYAEQLRPALPILAPWVKKFGYPDE